MSQAGWRGLMTRLRLQAAAFAFGAAMSWVMVPYAIRRQRELERLFLLVTVGKLLGASLVPPATRLRLLPFLVPQILSWRRRLALWDEDLESAHLKHLGH